jgi:uncharacterized protein (TIGR03790 family)
MVTLSPLGALAGGGPETTLLVVNAGSPLSLAVANEYVRLRDLPEGHVLWLEGVPATDTIDVETFRTLVLQPIREHLAATGLEREVDLIVYSAGFPYAVDFLDDLKAHGKKATKIWGTAGSLTGMTYFARQVEAGSIDYLQAIANQYARRPLGVPVSVLTKRAPANARVPVKQLEGLSFEAARGFRSRYLWGRGPGINGMTDQDHYVLSVMLGYAGLRGNSVAEIGHYLKRAVDSDGTQPEGGVYLMTNRNIRGRAREHLFDATIDALARRDRPSKVLRPGRDGQNGREPHDRGDVIGLVAGTRTFNWEDSGSTLLPGAIAESLTSYGGHFTVASQTKLTEFLRRGAAGSSGAVREPYALVEKFPLPLMHAYYADGASMAEAFFQSVLSPYQLLVVGDPLARPFASFATVELPDWLEGTTLKGLVRLRPGIRVVPGHPIERLELWVNGQRISGAGPGNALEIDTRALADGFHDLRVVAIEAGAIETRSYARRTVFIGNRGLGVALEPYPESVGLDESLVLKGSAGGARRVRVEQAGRTVGVAKVVNGAWRAVLDTALLGIGMQRLTVVAEWPDGWQARSEPVTFAVQAPSLVAADTAVDAGRHAGVRVRVEHRGSPPRSAELDGIWTRLSHDLRPVKADRIVFSGMVEARADGVYELRVESRGDVSFQLGGEDFPDTALGVGGDGHRFVLPLATGWHRFELSVRDSRSNLVRALMTGPEIAFRLVGDRVRID